MLAITFVDKDNYDQIREDDTINIIGLENFTPGKELEIELEHSDLTREKFLVNHTYNEQQIEWFKEGSALNCVKKELV
jgi:aconitate hydratase